MNLKPMKPKTGNPAHKRKRVRDLFARFKAKHAKKQALTSVKSATYKPR